MLNVFNETTSLLSFEAIVDKALLIDKEIKYIKKNQIKPLDDELKEYKSKLKFELDDEDIDKVEGEEGKATLVRKQGSKYLDEEMLMADLGVTNLDKYIKRKSGSMYVLLTPNKK